MLADELVRTILVALLNVLNGCGIEVDAILGLMSKDLCVLPAHVRQTIEICLHTCGL